MISYAYTSTEDLVKIYTQVSRGKSLSEPTKSNELGKILLELHHRGLTLEILRDSYPEYFI